MRVRLRRRWIGIAAAAVVAVATVGVEAATKPRALLILPYTPVDLGRDEQWVGEAVAQSLALAFVQTPAFIQIDRERLKRLSRADTWDDQAAQTVARAVAADVAMYGEVRRSGTELVIQPRYVEVKGERADRATLDVITVPEGTLMDRL